MEEEILKKYAFDSVATALASIVFPVPGGPNSRIPFGGARRPVNKSGRFDGKITVYENRILKKRSEPRREFALHISSLQHLPISHRETSGVKKAGPANEHTTTKGYIQDGFSNRFLVGIVLTLWKNQDKANLKRKSPRDFLDEQFFSSEAFGAEGLLLLGADGETGLGKVA